MVYLVFFAAALFIPLMVVVSKWLFPTQFRLFYVRYYRALLGDKRARRFIAAECALTGEPLPW
ncbi:MAG: hypothetical protein ACYSX0_22780, partial [Planctomycetota bacterium]